MGTIVRLGQTSKMGKLLKSPPRRVPNATVRSREYLTPAEVEKMMAAAKGAGRHGNRDAALILLAYRHALRVSELVALRRDQVDLGSGALHVNRLKNGTPAVHPLRGPEIRALRQLFREYPDSPYVFSTERKGPLTTSTVRKIVARAGELAGIPAAHPHQLRHATGYYLASKGQDTRAIQAYMGHRSISNTVRYTELSPDRFKGFWRD
jgi:type 1 fimbriae regulatory protein FimB/type 1 fimbriae regulatory protein FimE